MTLRLGHRFVDSANGDIVTWFDAHWDLFASPLTPQQRERVTELFQANHGLAARPRPGVGKNLEGAAREFHPRLRREQKRSEKNER